MRERRVILKGNAREIRAIDNGAVRKPLIASKIH